MTESNIQEGHIINVSQLIQRSDPTWKHTAEKQSPTSTTIPRASWTMD